MIAVPAELTYQRYNEKQPHKVIAIFYVKEKPSMVFTARHIPDATDGPYNRVHAWDFDENKKWGGDFMFYNSFSGGSDSEPLSNPGYTQKAKAKVWAAPGITFIEPLKNVKVIDTPIKLRGAQGKITLNPFEFALEEVSSTCYCKVCKGMVGDSWCDKHMHETDGELFYDEDDEPVDE